MAQNPKTLSPGRRRFYIIPGKDNDGAEEESNSKSGNELKTSDLFDYINSNIIGRNVVFSGPFGLRRVLYCDYVASGKPLQCFEDFIRKQVLPMYGNTHTTTTVTSLQSTLFRHEARDIIRNAVRASEHDAVIFTGNGVTGAVHKMISALNLDRPPVVFCGPFEHHSNLLPWREMAACVVNISETPSGQVNLDHLEAALKKWKEIGIPMIGCFSAVSNVTGQISDTVAISKVLHKYDALAMWDFATAGPYIDIDMHPVVADGDASKDAVFISPHKFVGGVGTPGLLIAARKLFKNRVPSDGGGGSVFFVTDEDHRYLQEEEVREEGGTPDIVGSIRAGLAFKLKQSVGCVKIKEREREIYQRVINSFSKMKNLELLGSSHDIPVNAGETRLPIFSFMIRHLDSGLYLHYSFITALLNDLFGMQVRGGCACAGPYAQSLLGMDLRTAKRIEQVLMEDSRLDRTHLRRHAEYSSHEVMRPGFVRFNLPYFFSDEEVDFIMEAISIVADSAWMLLPQYMFNPETGEWRHLKHQVFKDRKWLGHIKFTSEGMQFGETVLSDEKGSLPSNFTDCLRQARSIFNNASRASDKVLPDHPIMFDKSVEDLRWFLTPSEAQKWLAKNQGKRTPPLTKRVPPFVVRTKIELLTEKEIETRVAIPDMMRKRIVSMTTQITSVKSLSTPSQNGDESTKQKTEIIPVSSKNGKPESEKKQNPPKETNGHPNQGAKSQNGSNHETNTKVKFISPPKRLFKLTVQAIDEFKMINDGDRVLVCLSGGKDSLSLLHTLKQYQYYAKHQNVSFDLGAVTVDPKTASYDPTPLIDYLAALGLPYFYEIQAILDQALALPELTSICAFCSRMKRGRLYNCARREGWNVLAMGQHLDDLAESFLMSAFQNGLLRTMKANYTVREGDLRVIRPFVHVREKDTREFAEGAHLPIIPENCPACFEAPKERHRMKQLLASQEIIHPKLFYSLKEALYPLMAKNKTGMESGLSSPFMDDD